MAESTPFVVIAEFRVKPERLDAFLEVAADDAAHSVADEPGCWRFDVVVPDGGATVIFYEIYHDRAAFDAHLLTPHLQRFREAFPPLIEAELPVRFGLLQNPASG
ncbi:antibiotic biosynthesis monooxygenase [Alsobacter metallidurans]|uniref:Antibiotic biosynthesis monooxygenase n=1 Tax=Alsobacter metallidurans TaxID=340221 RepID=A0A917I9A8_9HYPH|nr:putative quinol monooxygenase [Alsobacter metallidurans]GGH24040.1 antibiotic biosynthesis monooxygenase [Alsobacter metallidurans]